MTVFGWDMSHFDSPSIGGAIADGIQFVTHKAGGDSNDAELGAWWDGVKGLDPRVCLLGAYWVLYPGTPASRADSFIARLDSQCPGWRDRPFLLQVDCEKWNGDPGTVPGKSDIRSFCDRLVQRMPKLRPVVYAPKWVYGSMLDGLDYPLWASSYVTGQGGFKALYPGDGDSRWNAYSGQRPAILQYTSSATIGGQTFSDANAFRGTLAQLTALVAPGWSDMATLDAEDLANIRNAIWGYDLDPSSGNSYSAGGALWTVFGRTGELNALPAQLDALNAAVAAIPGTDAAALAAEVVAGVLAGLTPEVIAAIPAELAQQVVDAFSQRLAT